MKSVVITGVSTGIGRYAAEYLIKQGFQVFGSIRNSSDGEALQAQFGERFIPLLFDVTDEVAIKQAALTVTDYLAGATLSGLVNNAGIAIPGPLMHLPMSELRHQFEVNVFGLMAVTQAFLPCLGAKLPQVEIPGRIVNISSVAGKMTFPFLGPYASSKHALESLSDALRRELLLYGIDVIVIEPGTIQTDIWNKVEQIDIELYKDTDYYSIVGEIREGAVDSGRRGRSPDVVSKTIHQALTQPKPRTRYALPDHWIMRWYLPRLLPDRWLDRLVASRLGMTRN